MSALDDRIRELVDFAREREGEDRSALFRNLIDLFLTGKAPTAEPTRSQLLDVIDALIPHVDGEDRRTVADLLAHQSTPPMDLVLRICRDRANLVSDLLMTVDFDEDDAIELIEITGREHHQILAGRSDLSANVWIALARATPNAAPYESQSTLALWRDDLGSARKHANSTSTVHPFSTGENVTPIRSEPETASKISPEKPDRARLRILRTDEEILADRLKASTEEAKVKLVTADIIPDTEQGLPAMESSVEDTSIDTDIIDEKDLITPGGQSHDEMVDHGCHDPCPGGWAWRSDRDGFITHLSNFAGQVFDDVEAVVGNGLLDMLNLNTKQGHPVSRAFQRRSAIHDAPIYLAHLDKSQRYWTLEATPHFCPSGGVFEGYEGRLAPVIPIEDEEDIIPACDTLDGPEAEGLATFLPEGRAVWRKQRQDKIQEPTAPISEPPVVQTTPKPEPLVAEEVAAAAAEMFSTDNIDAKLAETTSLLESPIEDDCLEGNDNAPLETLQLLDEAFVRMKAACGKGDAIQQSLQSEIIAACLKTLRTQLKSSN